LAVLNVSNAAAFIIALAFYFSGIDESQNNFISQIRKGKEPQLSFLQKE
jgi:hypothetical protein